MHQETQDQQAQPLLVATQRDRGSKSYDLGTDELPQ